MSASDAFVGAVANTTVPMVAAAFAQPPLPQELGLRGLIADERTRAYNAQAWQSVLPPALGIAAFIAAACFTYGIVRGT